MRVFVICGFDGYILLPCVGVFRILVLFDCFVGFIMLVYLFKLGWFSYLYKDSVSGVLAWA